MITISGSAPVIDQTTTTTGITITTEYLRNIPTGRTFTAVIGSSAGSQSDNYGTSFSGASSHENLYIVEGTSTRMSTYISHRVRFNPGVWGESNALTQDLVADAIKSSAFAFSEPYAADASSDDTPPVVKRPPSVQAYSGRLRDVMVAIHAGQRDRAPTIATKWQLANPGEVAAILGLGEALEARGADALASRAYGSLVDLYPNRVELVRPQASGSSGSRAGSPTPASSRSMPTGAHCASDRITRRRIACSHSRSCATIAATRRSICSSRRSSAAIASGASIRPSPGTPCSWPRTLPRSIRAGARSWQTSSASRCRPTRACGSC